MNCKADTLMKFSKTISLLISFLIPLTVYNVATTGRCNHEQFQCNDGGCISLDHMCDGLAECNDLSDEIYCKTDNYPKCNRFYLQCRSTKSCVKYPWICDGDYDCRDGTDEETCDKTACENHKEFKCFKNMQCIPMMQRCDGKIDCDDGSDEMNCNAVSHECYNWYFTCTKDHTCIKRPLLCDGKDDCDDGSDEKICELLFPSSIAANSTFLQTMEGLYTTVNSVIPEMEKESCPQNYCMQNADCIVINGQYYCNCTSSFTGEKCEMKTEANDGRCFSNLEIVVAIFVTSIILFIVLTTITICYYKRRSSRRSNSLLPKSQSQMPITSYSK